MEWPINLFEAVAVGCINGDVELRYGAEGGELRGVLGIAYKKGRDFARVKQVQKFVDLNHRAMSASVHISGLGYHTYG